MKDPFEPLDNILFCLVLVPVLGLFALKFTPCPPPVLSVAQGNRPRGCNRQAPVAADCCPGLSIKCWQKNKEQEEGGNQGFLPSVAALSKISDSSCVSLFCLQCFQDLQIGLCGSSFYQVIPSLSLLVLGHSNLGL